MIMSPNATVTETLLYLKVHINLSKYSNLSLTEMVTNFNEICV